ncbi:MAG: hypothetical protein WBZ37_12760 [Mycobacterium sp.]
MEVNHETLRDVVGASLVEVKKENWSFGNGIAHYVDAPTQQEVKP